MAELKLCVECFPLARNAYDLSPTKDFSPKKDKCDICAKMRYVGKYTVRKKGEAT